MRKRKLLRWISRKGFLRSDMSFLKLSDVTIGYPDKNRTRTIQKNLNLTADKGELIALIGKNGCGKSTLIRSIACLQPIFSGEISLENKDLISLKPEKRARLLSVVLTGQQSVASFNVRDLVSIGRDPYTGWLGSLSERDNEIISDAMKITYLEGFEDRSIYELSDGERQRVFIARALAQDTPLILLDEPTSHLDLPNRINILSLDRKSTRLNSSHVRTSYAVFCLKKKNRSSRAIRTANTLRCKVGPPRGRATSHNPVHPELSASLLAARFPAARTACSTSCKLPSP